MLSYELRRRQPGALPLKCTSLRSIHTLSNDDFGNGDFGDDDFGVDDFGHDDFGDDRDIFLKRDVDGWDDDDGGRW